MIQLVCGLLTLYFPPESLLQNIDTYINYIDKLYVVDNTPLVNTLLHSEIKAKYSKVDIVSSGDNIGIAAALNIGIREGIRNEYAWLLTMDQDSSFAQDQADKYFSSLGFLDAKDVAIVSPLHERPVTDSGVCEYEKKIQVMTSGNLLNLALTEDIGLFNEALFIDSVDHDYCLRANLCGKNVLQTKNCYIIHEVGNCHTSSLLFGYRKRTFHMHSAKRMYFIVRNNLYLRKEYRNEFPEFIRIYKKVVNNKISKTLRYGDNKLVYLKYIIKAYRDFYLNKYGNQVGL